MNAKLIALAGRRVLAAYKADRANRYGLTQPWTLAVDAVWPAYTGRHLTVAPCGLTTRVTVQPFEPSANVADGASFAPDSPRGVRQAALLHDVWYDEADDMAKEWQMPVGGVLKMGDDLFSSVMAREKTPWYVRRLYYNAVRRLGWLAHKAKLISLVVLMAGLQGCLSPPDILVPGQYESPGTNVVHTTR